jgi:rhodanese-related sulfurtransferase
MALAALSSRSESVAGAPRVNFLPEHPILQQARAVSRSLPQAISYAGSVSPAQAWELVSQQAAVLLDVRTAEERKFVGYVPGSLHLPWLLGTAMQTNPRFARELESKIPKDAVILLLCRSGARSASAAAAAHRAGFSNAFNVQEGFEGDLDQHGHRGGRNGWRFHGLPWIQD